MTGVKLSSINFRRKIHSIKTIEEFINSTDYIAQFVRNRFRCNKEAVDFFLEKLAFQFTFNTTNIDAIKIWILNYTYNLQPLLGKDPESPLYEYIYSTFRAPQRDNGKAINISFNDFYQNYSANVSHPLNKNHVSRALNALGINPVMKKLKISGPPGLPGCDRKKSTMMIQVTDSALSDILKKNGFTLPVSQQT
jgi:hypothetical protein